MEKIELTKDQLKNILHAATGNVRDFVMNEDRFIKEWLDEQLILHPVGERDRLMSDMAKLIDRSYNNGREDCSGIAC
jgi:hypothetical protein